MMSNTAINRGDDDYYNSQKIENMIPNINIEYDDGGSLLNSNTYSSVTSLCVSKDISKDNSNTDEIQKQNNISGMSIFGLDGDDDGMEESLLLSPILADYVPTTAATAATAATATEGTNTTATMSKTFTPPKFKSPDSNVLSSSSTSKRIRSSARLRRRRDILFSSPANIIREEDGEDNNLITANNDNNLDGGNGSLLRGALDTSFCPSLGLGSSISADNEEGGELGSAMEEQLGCSDGTEEQEQDNTQQVSEEERDGDGNVLVKDSNDTLGGNNSHLSLSSSLSRGTMEELDYSMKSTDLGEEDYHNNFDKTNNNATKASQYKFLSYSNASIRYEQQEEQERLQKEEGASRFDESDQSKIALPNTPDRGDSKQIEEHYTPPRSSSRKESLNLTPKLKDVAKQVLTPVLEALRSKLRRDSSIAAQKNTACYEASRGNEGVVESGVEGTTDQFKSTNAITTNHMSDTDRKVSFLFQSPPTQRKSDLSMNTSITPVLKSLRSKLYQGLNNETINTTHHDDTNNDVGGNNDSNNDILTAEVNTADTTTAQSQSPAVEEMLGNRSERKNQEEKSEAKTPSNLDDKQDGLSLTPALKAFRSKLLGSSSIEAYSSQKFSETSISPIGDIGPKEANDTISHLGSLFSPPVRVLNKTPTSTSDKSRGNMTAEGDDSYLAQPKDLSSAKKNLSAQSSALVERLRGAAQKRMVQLTKKRESLAAKENVHLERKDSASKISSDESTKGGNEKKEVTEQPKTKSTKRSQFKARPLPSTTKSGVPNIEKKALTKPISPKLGKRLPSRSKSRNRGGTSQQQEKDPFYVPPFKARPVPASLSKDYNKGKSGVPNVKRRPLTTPISPHLGLRRNAAPMKTSGSARKQLDSCREKTKDNQMLSPNEPVGLDFLRKTPVSKGCDENIPPSHISTGFHLHSTERAKERAKFDASFALRKKEREKQKRMEMDLLIKQRLHELDALKQSLR